MAKRKIMGVQEARQNFAAVVAAAAKDGERTILFRRSTPAAVVVPAEWFHRAAELMGEPWEDWTPPAEKPGPHADEHANLRDRHRR